MAFLRQWLLIWFTLILGAETILAASARENRDYAAAAAAFQAGMYDRATNDFAQFVVKYPVSDHAAEAVLLRAQAELKLGKFADAVARLTSTDNLAKAGKLADEYFFWAGEVQFEAENYPDAADKWIALSQKFPESRLRLQAVVEAASAFAKISRWPQTVALLENPPGVFQRAAQKNPGDEQVVRGELLLAQAKLALKDFAGASAVLEPLLGSKTLKPDLHRQCALLFYQVKMAAGEPDAALAATTNLLQIARLENHDGWTAEGLALRGGALKKLGRWNEALAVYQQNLTTNTPAEWQHDAVLNIADLAIAQNLFTVATNALEKFIVQFPDSPAADIAQLTWSELNLKNYAAQLPATNQLADLQAQFTQFIGTFTNSPLLGKAYLDRGWCNWLAGKIPESFDDFKTAAQKIAARQLPPSEDLLVAWFKMGDAQFKQKDFAGALENYRAVLDGLKISPDAGPALGDPALYQILRASVEMNDAAGASNAFAQIIQNHPNDGLTRTSSLLYGESMASPGEARTLFEKLSAQLSGSPLQPQVALAVSRTYEREQNWPAAVTNYENWLDNFPTNALQAQVSYALGQADFRARNETNAFRVFTNFVAQFPTNELAPLAQWWVADHFFRAGEWTDAERNYKSIFQNPNWQDSPLVGQAQMMAGRAALGRLGYTDAIGYFGTLAETTNELAVSARLAYGSTLMLMNSTVTNNPLANFQQAALGFGQIAQANPTNEAGALAWFYLGDCYLQLTNYDAATNAYAQVFNSPYASVTARSQAQAAYGNVLEKMAALAAGDDQKKALLELAKNDYADVLFAKNLRDGEISDPFWVKKAGLQAAAAAETLGEWEEAIGIYTELKTKWLPQLGGLLDQKIAGANTHLPQKKN